MKAYSIFRKIKKLFHNILKFNCIFIFYYYRLNKKFALYFSVLFSINFLFLVEISFHHIHIKVCNSGKVLKMSRKPFDKISFYYRLKLYNYIFKNPKKHIIYIQPCANYLFKMFLKTLAQLLNQNQTCMYSFSLIVGN